MLLGTCSLREVQHRWGRAVLTVLGIAVGIAVLIAAQATARSARHAYRAFFEDVAGPDSLEIVTPELAGFDPGVTARLRATAGISALVPRIVATAALATPSGTIPVLAIGLPADGSCPAACPEVCSGMAFTSEEGAWIDVQRAAEQHLAVGMELEFWTPRRRVKLPLRGLVRSHGAQATQGLPVVWLPLPVAQWMLCPTWVNSVQVLLSTDADRELVHRSLQEQLPPGLVVQSPGSRAEAAAETLHAAIQGLDALALIAPLVGTFLVLNTFLLNLAERRKRLAMLHVLGATCSQVHRLVIAEALGIGLVGGLLGLALGAALERGLASLMGHFWGIAPPESSLSFALGLGGLLAGLLLTMAASALALWQHRRLSPLEALQGRIDPAPATNQTPSLRSAGLAVCGLLVTCGTVVQMVMTGAAQGSNHQAVPISLLFPIALLGCLLVLPLLNLATLHAVSRLLHRRLGVALQLAMHQVQRARSRTNLSVAVFFIAGATAVAFGHHLSSASGGLEQWYRRAIPADFLVRAAAPDAALLMTPALPERLADDLRAVAGVQRVDALRFLPVRVNGHGALLLARTFAADEEPPLDLISGKPEDVRQRVLAGEVVLGTALAQRLHLGVGDSLVLDTSDGAQQLRIAGIVVEYGAGGQALYLEWSKAQTLLHFSGAHVFLTCVSPGCAAEAADALRDFCASRKLTLQSNAEMSGFLERLLVRVSAVLWALIALGFVIAALAIVNTLAMNLQEQGRDYAVCHAVGMTRWQILSAVLWQAALLVTVGILPATAAGTALAWLLERTCGILPGRISFAPHLSHLSGCLVLAYLAGLAAGALTGWQFLRHGRCPTLRS
jgi:putative ABC transport system permease protein